MKLGREGERERGEKASPVLKRWAAKKLVFRKKPIRGRIRKI